MTMPRPRLARRLLPLLVAAAGLAAGCRGHAEAPAAPPEAAARVALETVEPRVLADTVEAVGTVRSRQQSVLSSRIVAAVVAVHVREGETVRAGQVLVELDDRDVRAQLERARAGLREATSALEEVERAIEGAERAVDSAAAQEELARVTHDRYQRLLERELIARQDYDQTLSRLRVATAEAARARQALAAQLARRRQALARIEQAQAEVESAAIVTGYARIVAPGPGIVAARTVEVGNLAAPGTPLLTLDEERYRLEATVHESDLPRLRLGQRAAVTIDALGRPLEGPIVEIVPAADPLSRTFTVKVELPPVPGLRSGLYGRAAFGVGTRQALLIPRAALARQGQLEGVYVADAGVARLRLVRTGKGHDDRVEILSGLAPGERVVADARRVADGQPVDAAR
jgi:multidrug efflux pump subunit AcrA (membrane-fusion protein)